MLMQSFDSPDELGRTASDTKFIVSLPGYNNLKLGHGITSFSPFLQWLRSRLARPVVLSSAGMTGTTRIRPGPSPPRLKGACTVKRDILTR
jgi:hypothetical protein